MELHKWKTGILGPFRQESGPTTAPQGVTTRFAVSAGVEHRIVVSGPSFTIGVEEEYLIVDAETRDLRPRAESVLPPAQRVLGEQVQPELSLSQIEVETGVCDTLAEVRTELSRLRAEVTSAAEKAGSRLAASGTHPFADWRQQAITPKERYLELDRDFRLLAREQLISGCHVHVGVEDPDEAIAVMDRCRPWLPVLLALSTNSPFWEGVDTGYSSFRTQVFDRWPVTGPPPVLGTRAEYDRVVEQLVATGSIVDATKLYWDVRPSSRYPTVEFRICDVCLTVDEAVLIAGLTRSLVRTCHAQAAAGEPVPCVRSEVLRAARWRAARDGLDDGLVDPGAGLRGPNAATGVRGPNAATGLRGPNAVTGLRGPNAATGQVRPAAEVVASFLAFLRPDLEAAGEWDEVSALAARTLATGTGARRQREVFERTGSLVDLVDWVVGHTIPAPSG